MQKPVVKQSPLTVPKMPLCAFSFTAKTFHLLSNKTLYIYIYIYIYVYIYMQVVPNFCNAQIQSIIPQFRYLIIQYKKCAAA